MGLVKFLIDNALSPIESMRSLSTLREIIFFLWSIAAAFHLIRWVVAAGVLQAPRHFFQDSEHDLRVILED